jgi:hypothetical protein
MGYLPGYLVYCWFVMVFNVLESIAGDFPYRPDHYHSGRAWCRPQSYSEYYEFRKQQDG